MGKTAYFSGGRYEGLIDIFNNKPGVIDVTGGSCKTTMGSKVAVLVNYDEENISYETLVTHLIKNVDLTDDKGQFDDRGDAFTSVIYYQSEAEIIIAREVLSKASKQFKSIFVEVMPFLSFDELAIDARCESVVCKKKHQTKVLLEKRYQKIADLWKDTYSNQIKKLSPLSFQVTKNNHTERPYTSDFVTNSKKGIYVDIISNEPLFSSLDQFDAGCGWPSFTKSITKLLEKTDKTYGMSRIEIRSIHSDAHLGHVFDDGPSDKGGLRYCINGASLKFIAYNDLEKEGFKAYQALFK